MGETLLFNKLFLIVDVCLRCKNIARQSCAMANRWQIFGDFLGTAFPASCAEHIRDLHSKFALGPHHVQKYGRLVIWYGNLRRLRLGEEKKEDRRIRY